jgi:hypothetical protein
MAATGAEQRSWSDEFDVAVTGDDRVVKAYVSPRSRETSADAAQLARRPLQQPSPPPTAPRLVLDKRFAAAPLLLPTVAPPCDRAPRPLPRWTLSPQPTGASGSVRSCAGGACACAERASTPPGRFEARRGYWDAVGVTTAGTRWRATTTATQSPASPAAP